MRNVFLLRKIIFKTHSWVKPVPNLIRDNKKCYSSFV